MLGLLLFTIHNLIYNFFDRARKEICINKRTISRTGTGTDQNFIIGYWYFLKKRKLPTYIIRCRYFSCCYLFVSLWHFIHMFLTYLSSDGLTFFCFSLCGILELLLCLKSKKHKGSNSLPSLIGSCHKSYLHISAIIFGWMARSLNQRFH